MTHLTIRTIPCLLAAVLLTAPTVAHAQAPPDADAQGGTNSAGLPSRVQWTFNLDAGWGSLQELRAAFHRLRKSGRKEQEQHLKNHRPWGHFETLNIGPRFQVKLLHVNPGGRLSLQMHHHRSEHWVVVCGTAKVTIGDCEKLVQENESVYVTATEWHAWRTPARSALN